MWRASTHAAVCTGLDQAQHELPHLAEALAPADTWHGCASNRHRAECRAWPNVSPYAQLLATSLSAAPCAFVFVFTALTLAVRTSLFILFFFFFRNTTYTLPLPSYRATSSLLAGVDKTKALSLLAGLGGCLSEIFGAPSRDAQVPLHVPFRARLKWRAPVCAACGA